jgi:hypothetical protein
MLSVTFSSREFYLLSFKTLYNLDPGWIVEYLFFKSVDQTVEQAPPLKKKEASLNQPTP